MRITEGSTFKMPENEGPFKVQARRSSISEEKIAAAVKCLRQGVPRTTAYTAMGVSYATGLQWYRAGQRDDFGKMTPDPLYRKFYDAVLKAEREFMTEQLNNVTDIALKDRKWQASSWVLERRFKKEFGPQPPEVEGLAAKTIADAIEGLIVVEGPEKGLIEEDEPEEPEAI